MGFISSKSVFYVSIIAVFIAYAFLWSASNNINKQSAESHPYIIFNDFISSSEAKSLRDHFENIARFPRGRADFSSSLYTDIGEAYKPNTDGQCDKPRTILHPKLNLCVFLPRMDVIPNYYLSGGFEGFKEDAFELRARSSLFINHQFNAYNKSEYAKLFGLKSFTNAIRSICGSTNQFIKPIELNLALQLPGQHLLAHIDAVYFKDATRKTHPLWLLTVMKESKLFNNTLIPQIQGVLYIGKNNQKGGEIYTYPNGIHKKVVLIPPTTQSVVIMDGTQIIHGTTVYNPECKPPAIFGDNNKVFFLQFEKDNNKWRVYEKQNGNDVPTEYVYSWDDIRASIAYRALCFENENEMNLWTEQQLQSDLSIDEILQKFKIDLIEKKRITENEWNKMNRYEIGYLLVDQYIELPQSELAWIKTNYRVLVDFYCNNRPLYQSVMHRGIQYLLCSTQL